MSEMWLPIIGYEGLYEVSDLGRVRSVERIFKDKSGHIHPVHSVFLKIDDRYSVNLFKDGKYRNKVVRSIVAEAFLSIPYGTSISHIDRDISNSELSNLVLTSEFCKLDPNWHDIPGWEGEYQASYFGAIRSVDRYVVTKSGSLRYCQGVERVFDLDDSGYYQVALYRNGVSQVTTHVARLIAQAWIPNPENKPTVNHIDGNKLNNCVSNLEWATYSEQQQHVIRTGLRKAPWWTFERNGPVGGDWNARRQVKVRCIETGIEYPSLTAAAESVSATAIEVLNSVNKHSVCQGFHFVRADERDYSFGISCLPGEYWRDVPEFEGRYMMSSLGRVKSVERKVRCARGFRTVPEKLISLKYGLALIDCNGETRKFNFNDMYSSIFHTVLDDNNQKNFLI